MDKRFFKYLKEKKDVVGVAIFVALGLVLLILGGRSADVSTDELDGIEERIAEACSNMDGVGECSVYVYYSSDGSHGESEVESVIVVCDGADSVEVRLKLTEMLSSFFGIGSNRVKIEKKKV